MSPALTAIAPPSSVVIERVRPELDGGRYPVKREVGDTLEVTADIVREGHDKIAAVVRYRPWNREAWSEAEMRLVDNDRWAGEISLTENTRYHYTIQAFPDAFATWRDELAKKSAAGQDVASELLEGRAIVDEAAGRADGSDRAMLDRFLADTADASDQAGAVALMLDDALARLMARHRSRAGAATYDRDLTVIVDRVRARYAAWYEIMPRSAGAAPGQSGTFADVVSHLPRIRAMGFDVLYFLPIHPIGKVNRKGPNNTLKAGPNDPGSPYAIGSDEGGHDALEPSLGTLDDFKALVAAARDQDLEIALDFAINCAPDHPWVQDHPEWFSKRPDGTIKFAENPPKKYEDIYPVNFNTPDWRALWEELKRVVMVWVDLGVTHFRVDNPHTKPTVFWEWLIAEVQRTNPEVVFLSEAFTRPKVMKSLAKAGFTQSYTYFTWRNHKRELEEYFTELTQSEVAEYMRGNLFPVTPDILPYALQEGGRPAFRQRLILAATLSSVYGVYAPFELCENTPVPGKEEYLNSEKYDYKVWDWDRPGNIVADITAINAIRRAHPALQEYDNLRFFWSDDDSILVYGKSTPDHADNVLVVVNLDPFATHETMIHFPLDAFGLLPGEPYRATDLLSDQTWQWSGGTQYVKLDPLVHPAHVFVLEQRARVEYAEPCF